MTGPQNRPPAAEAESRTVPAGGISHRDAAAEPAGAVAPQWRRLHPRVVWVDTAKALLSLIPGGLAIFVFGQEINGFVIGSACVATVVGVLGAIADLLRWLKTRYRITEDRVELRTGFFFRKHRTVRLDRIRSIDAKAKLRHRLAGLRILKIEAGQQGGAGESALSLDAVSTQTARRLRTELLHRARAGDAVTDAADAADAARSVGAVEAAGSADATGSAAPAKAPGPTDPAESSPLDGETVLTRMRWHWFIHNIFNVFAFLMAAGLLWGVGTIAEMFGANAFGFAAELVGWQGFGHWPGVVTAAVALWIAGVAGLAVNFFAENWNFTLTRELRGSGSTLRTEKGLFSTREVNRDEDRLRGVQISRSLLWRWMGTAATLAISTGLSVMSESRNLLPNTHVRQAHATARLVLPEAGALFAHRLPRHPAAALRRRLFRATVTTAVPTGALVYLGAVVPGFSGTAWLYCGAILWPVSLGLAVASYLSLGHLVDGDFIVTRSGATSTNTAVLQRRAVIGWTLKQSVFQRRLRLMSVTAATAAGDKHYEVPDAAAQDALRFADAALPGLLRPFLEPVDGGGNGKAMPRGDTDAAVASDE